MEKIAFNCDAKLVLSIKIHNKGIEYNAIFVVGTYIRTYVWMDMFCICSIKYRIMWQNKGALFMNCSHMHRERHLLESRVRNNESWISSTWVHCWQLHHGELLTISFWIVNKFYFYFWFIWGLYLNKGRKA